MSASAENKMINAQEVQLLEAVAVRRPGWQQAFASLMDAYRPYLYWRCVGHLHNAADAEDVLQESFLNAYRFADRFEGRASLKTWLTRIADNQCYTFLRKRQQYASVEHLLAVIEIHEAAQAAMEIEEDHRRQFVAEAMGSVSPKAREVLALRYWLELPLEEISATLGIGLSATKMRLHRAHRQCLDVMDSNSCLVA
jgi:RNA polymerase sigma-70 factor (ECF subfamily)